MNPAPDDHRGLDIERWAEAYSGGEPVAKSEIYAAVSGCLAPVLPGYRYLRSMGIFHLPDATADHYLALDRTKGILTVRFGLTHHLVEEARRLIFGPTTVRLKNKPLTISMYSWNMGPHSKGWHLPYRVQWPILGEQGLSKAIPEIRAFVEGTVLPYLERHRRPEAIRETYLLKPGQADFYFLSEQIIFAVDHVLKRMDWLKTDRIMLIERQGIEANRLRIEEAYNAVLRTQNGPEHAA